MLKLLKSCLEIILNNITTHQYQLILSTLIHYHCLLIHINQVFEKF